MTFIGGYVNTIRRYPATKKDEASTIAGQNWSFDDNIVDED